VFLNVTSIRRHTRVNGPGTRNALWVQGCTLRCPGCFNPNTHEHQARELWEPSVLARRLVEPAIEGITILGGEPFEQAAACAVLARTAKELGASVVTYSGYTWRYLKKSRLTAIRDLLDATDLLIAGPFIESRATNGEGWHGSSNQELVLLTKRYVRADLRNVSNLPRVEVRIDGEYIDITGIPACSDRLLDVPSTEGVEFQYFR